MRLFVIVSFSLLLIGCRKVEKVSLREEKADWGGSIQNSGQLAFEDRLAEIHQEWMGTPWDFSGTSQVPREGSIACGYFVTTTLQQAGFELERIRLAQAASETMIRAICPEETIRRYRDVALAPFLESVKEQGDGYYVVGLDRHTGFLRVKVSGEILFVHSGAGRGVVVETPEDAPELARSRYRVIGKVVESLALPPP
ncbi:MAG: hypothetical protein P1U85_03850 [Verrucomicrobiales bacterium]|jgi:hypothetical protein|nr:hypothetical protein [Verrucomicrobiales bacterium]